MPGSSVSGPLSLSGIGIPNDNFQWISERFGGIQVLNMAMTVQLARQGMEATGGEGLTCNKKRLQAEPATFNDMGWTMGLEPTASWATTRCSNQLSYVHRPNCLGKSALLIPARFSICKNKVMPDLPRSACISQPGP